jgi:hypothetical protein
MMQASLFLDNHIACQKRAGFPTFLEGMEDHDSLWTPVKISLCDPLRLHLEKSRSPGRKGLFILIHHRELLTLKDDTGKRPDRILFGTDITQGIDQDPRLRATQRIEAFCTRG